MATDLTTPTALDSPIPAAIPYEAWADRILEGGELSRDEARQILDSPDEDVLRLLSAGFRLREKNFGKTVQLYFLMNAKSGLCPEDCHYCSQSKISEAPVPKYNILKRDELMDAARVAAERGKNLLLGDFCSRTE